MSDFIVYTHEACLKKNNGTGHPRGGVRGVIKDKQDY